MKLSKASQFRKRVHPGSFFPFPWPQALSASPLGIWAVCSFWVNSTGMPNLGAGAQARVSAWWAQESEQSSLHSTPTPAQSGLSHAVQVSMWRGTEAWFLLSPPFFFFVSLAEAAGIYCLLLKPHQLYDTQIWLNVVVVVSENVIIHGMYRRKKVERQTQWVEYFTKLKVTPVRLKYRRTSN